MADLDVRDLVRGAPDPEVKAAAEILVEHADAPDRVELALRCGRDFVLPLEAARRRVGELETTVARLETLVASLESAVELVAGERDSLAATVRAETRQVGEYLAHIRDLEARLAEVEQCQVAAPAPLVAVAP